MSAILVENVKEESLNLLQAQAATHGKSLQAELQGILEAAATEADHQVLRGWGMRLPVPRDLEREPDSVDQLEAYMSACWPNAQEGCGFQAEPRLLHDTAMAARGRSGPVARTEVGELDSVGQLEAYMASCWPNA